MYGVGSKESRLPDLSRLEGNMDAVLLRGGLFSHVNLLRNNLDSLSHSPVAGMICVEHDLEEARELAGATLFAFLSAK